MTLNLHFYHFSGDESPLGKNDILLLLKNLKKTNNSVTHVNTKPKLGTIKLLLVGWKVCFRYKTKF